MRRLFAALIPCAALLAALVAAPPPAPAQPTEAAAAVEIPPDEWRAMTDGAIVYYRIGGLLHGREYYPPGGDDEVVFQFADGACMAGDWTWSAGVYCFHFDRAHCFRHVREGGRIFAIPEQGGADQEATIVHGVPFSCAPSTTS